MKITSPLNLKTMKKSILALVAMFAWACSPGPQSEEEDSGSQIKTGLWRGAIALNDSVDLPFNFELDYRDSLYSMVIHNAEERIEVTEITEQGDSLKIVLPVFANYLLVQKGGERLSGFYVNPDAENYRLPFSAVFGDSARFKGKAENCCDINKKWRVQFDPGTEEEGDAIAYFEQKGTYVEGSILTETGDYRYLEGSLIGNHLQLSTFDGAHLMYFEATIEDGQKMNGRFYSGRSYMAPWVGFRDQDFELANPDSLTYLKEGYDTFSFSFPDLEGKEVSLADDRFKNKPVIVQIMGSWCPNCMDESRYLKKVYQEYHDKGLEVMGLTFERVSDRETALKRATKMKRDLELPYPILLAGATRQDRAGDTLPMLNHVMSYPTAIYLDRHHRVVKIHTGFSGPGTPVYEDFVAKNKSTLEDLVKE